MLYSLPLFALLKRMASIAKPLVVFVLGGPGAGKGTQCARIVKVSYTSLSWRTNYTLGINGVVC